MNLKRRLRSGPKERRGIASVIGTMIFVVVLMMAVGAQTYIGGLQAQSNQSSQLAQEAANLHGDESLTFSNPASGLVVVNGGQSSSEIVAMYLRYPNGSVYSGSSFTPVYLPPSASASVQAIVPSGTCLPTGTSTCLSRYEAVTESSTPGYSVGLTTSLGNTFWYTPAASSPPSWTKATFLTSGTWSVPSGVATVYVVCIGGGGGGGGSGGATDSSGPSGSDSGAGGGVGSLIQTYVSLEGVNSVVITIGQGGSPGSAGGATTSGGSGGDGSPSSFGTFLACGGGQGGGGGYYNYNAGSGASCASGSPSAQGGAGDGIPGGESGYSGVAANAMKYTLYGGGGGGGGQFYTPPGSGSWSSSLSGGSMFTSSPGTSGGCAPGGGGGSASPFSNGATGGNGATTCSSGQAGESAPANTGTGGGGAGGSYSTTSACGSRAGAPGGSGGTGEVIVYYEA
jgi:hypothetical protein